MKIQGEQKISQWVYLELYASLQQIRDIQEGLKHSRANVIQRFKVGRRHYVGLHITVLQLSFGNQAKIILCSIIELLPNIFLFFLCQILLDHTTNLSVGVEVFTNSSLFIERASDLLCCATEWTIGYRTMRLVSFQHGRLSKKVIGRRRYRIIPLNIFPTAPVLSKMLVPVPCVLSPAAGWKGYQAKRLECHIKQTNLTV